MFRGLPRDPGARFALTALSGAARCPSGSASGVLWPGGVDPNRFRPGRRCAVWVRRLRGGEAGAPLLLYAGRVSPEKSLHLLGPILDALPGARLAIVGDGPARASLEATLDPSRVVFTGFLRGDALARADALEEAPDGVLERTDPEPRRLLVELRPPTSAQNRLLRRPFGRDAVMISSKPRGEREKGSGRAGSLHGPGRSRCCGDVPPRPRCR